MAARIFRDDERGYLSGAKKNSSGLVVNTRKVLDPDYLVLHRASCATVLRHRNMAVSPGGFTERAYQKICALSVDELHQYLLGAIGRQKTFTKLCTRCNPDFP